MTALQRGASNLYFPNVSSSILIPPFSSKIHRILREKKNWDMLKSSSENGDVPRLILEVLGKQNGEDPDQLELAYRQIINGEGDDKDAFLDETEFRYREYEALHQERRKLGDLLTCRPQDISKYRKEVRDWIGGITLVERLAETRALTGFTRIETSGVAPAKLARVRKQWLPAFRVHGEGIFLSIDENRLSGFEKKSDEQILKLLQRAKMSGRFELAISRELVFLHTLAHILIKRLSFEAGYGSSSIRERIYSAPEGHHRRMCGILLYTAAGDADGTLGGLVGLGRPGAFERVLSGALEESQWCAADPICSECSGQGPGSMNLAACHACSLLPETSCELQNRLLDRVTLQAFFDSKRTRMR